MTSSAHKLSDELKLLDRAFAPIARSGGYLDAASVKRLRERIGLLGKLANALETEVSYFRLIEAGREGKQIVEQLATDNLVQLVKDPEGKIIFPDFGRKK
ncbi:hypothetical protein [Rhizobium sp. S163]|uniref:hypothetical protein n=1 Tax=Rhizobium sp. S163 TaxID=3055039 RepID=UPI0025A94344|nr:hypothetical protein [Rhizobium sp. S163]MDM9647720.1 hypothetical protein [Rhizobium sp. S163]